MDNVLRVTTPENIAFEYRLAGPFRRIFAYLLDLLVSLGGYWGVILILYLLVIWALLPLAIALGLEGPLETFLGIVAGLLTIGYFVVYWFYGAYAETYFNGRTVGKAVARMRVITVDGHAIDGVQATLRNFFRLLDIMPFVPLASLFDSSEIPPQIVLPTCLFGLVIMALNRRYQRLGDLVANTVVITEERQRRPDLEQFEDPRVPALAELIPDSLVVPPSLARAVADYAENRHALNTQRSREIASYVSRPLLSIIGLPADTDPDLLLCALYRKIFLSAPGEEFEQPLAHPGLAGLGAQDAEHAGAMPIDAEEVLPPGFPQAEELA